MLKWAAVMFAGAVVSIGCANINSIGRSSGFGRSSTNKAIHLDIKQRVVISREGGNIVCAEPSPDALSAFASAGSGGANVQGYGNAAAALAMSEAASSVGLRTQSITLMRDALYRICEAYYNGKLSATDVKLLLTRTQDLTAAVVSIEQLTGAVVAQQAALGGGANAVSSAAMLANAEALAQTRELEKKYTEEVKTAKDARDKAAEDLTKAQQAQPADAVNVSNKQRGLDEAQAQLDLKQRQ